MKAPRGAFTLCLGLGNRFADTVSNGIDRSFGVTAESREMSAPFDAAIAAAYVACHELIESLDGGASATTRHDAAWHEVAESIGSIERSARNARVLAINAGIEAAYVDHLGTGFGIVAERMRALSASTLEAARSVRKIIARTRWHAAQTLEQTDYTRDQVNSVIGLLANHDLSSASDRLQRLKFHGDQIIDNMGGMHAASVEAESILSAIGDVSDEAGLLAINAAIEAARAAERGLGFTVIADEIAKLASATRGSTDVIISKIVKLRERSGRLKAASAVGVQRRENIERYVAAARALSGKDQSTSPV